ncbi:conjugal transfer protein TrbD [Mesorhizobium sp. M2D.F.Ca.ET.185.01.1.1]|uniref:conjugal transfer protein TrbD n=1 Tax=unclassified Mesorhizobium TaxID=325217 RepID=UPI000FCCA004|nr:MULTISPECIES: conjugal transfer protein TrbD [unclassified Mesorhizobium]TGP77255.1 conjugal transfer protein TrbD [bacterium M00.F.Ca.ET.227.01.1.1]TGP93048.1 conjugal transfer protein TrbD [bacterium M00.F.Ca.ET.222.01.1.1]TGP96594.1 conjugal transfer protein TrbD [bacterium M00.F.Ca.ET.221.01.1.1]TGT95815.1 conjugal transfer protein TrbD [bacterium M00.F.Ca.ET.163.01.1.1]TGU20775.1 conjugal transfer protein TrbD [bacterium M00.F.Ca.ET.156.01.1.1]TGU49806.1 conjugal transfer protein TrbD
MSDTGSSLVRSRVHRALSRPNLLMGADREMVLLTGLAAVILIFVVLTWYAALFGVAIWLVAVAALRMMAKSDPLMRRVYLRHISFRSYYRATSTPWRRY